VTAVNTQMRNSNASMNFTIEVSDVGQLRRALAQIAVVRGAVAAGRR
jgi:hypothetical protein